MQHPVITIIWLKQQAKREEDKIAKEEDKLARREEDKQTKQKPRMHKTCECECGV